MSAQGLSPVIAIRQKEMEIADRLEAARQSAEHTIADTRGRAIDQLNQAGEQARREAEACYQSEMASVEKAAEQLCLDGHQIAARILERGSRRLDEAVQLIITIVLPETEGG